MDRDSTNGNSATSGNTDSRSATGFLFRWGCLPLLLIAVVLLVLNVRIPPGENRPAVRVSPGTTWITSPLKPNGDVDYIAWLNQRNSEGVTPDNNAFVDVVLAIGSRPDGDVPAEFFDMLGISRPAPAGPHRPLETWLAKRGNGPARMLQTTVGMLPADDVCWLTRSVPWTAADCPDIAEWLAEQEQVLAGLRAGMNKPGWYAPIAGQRLVDEPLYYRHQIRELARSLLASSMFHTGSGDADRAIDDIAALFRLARHTVSKGGIEALLTGIAVEGMAHSAAAQLIHGGLCTDGQLARLDREIRGLPPPESLLAIIEFERCFALDTCTLGVRDGSKFLQNYAGMPPHSGASSRLLAGLARWTVNWETAMQDINSHFDQVESALSEDDPAKQRAALAALEAGLAQQPSPASMVTSLLMSPGSRGKLAGKLGVRMLAPAFYALSGASTRARAGQEVLLAGLAVERFRLRHGRLPATLDELVPEFLPGVPGDPWSSDQPLVYRVAAIGDYHLYSIGPNSRDDGGIEMDQGRWPNIDQPAVPRIRTIADWQAQHAPEVSGQ